MVEGAECRPSKVTLVTSQDPAANGVSYKVQQGRVRP